MLKKTLQSIAFIYITIGISGIAGAIERGTGLVSSLSFLISGTAIMYLEYKNVKEKENEEKTTDNNLSGSSHTVLLDKHIQSGRNIHIRSFFDRVHRILLR